MKKAKEDWIDTQCKEIDACLNKNNSKKAYQLVKDLTSEKQGRSTTIQDKSGKCLTEEQEILSRWTVYCSELYNYSMRVMVTIQFWEAGYIHNYPGQVWEMSYRRTRDSQQMDRVLLRAIQLLYESYGDNTVLGCNQHS